MGVTPLPAITVELRNADPDLTALLAEFVAGQGWKPGGLPATILVETRTQCDTIGAALAEFVAAHPGPYEMVVDGPAAMCEIFQLHTVDNTNAIVGALAASSGLL
ncbi:hypothetical protein [Jidongwangia harbinensis]|uniref:hypothetical protein n=1 Tax=Jidongwangia harbinensis TaxID=2878561 RepID=UPI001CD93E2C|nr:hypothetical protein [Jidongwangia harbinensis]MCA2212572.1 hypothetical protein [Jidongwangia harbinensis]